MNWHVLHARQLRVHACCAARAAAPPLTPRARTRHTHTLPHNTQHFTSQAPLLLNTSCSSCHETTSTVAVLRLAQACGPTKYCAYVIQLLPDLAVESHYLIFSKDSYPLSFSVLWEDFPWFGTGPPSILMVVVWLVAWPLRLCAPTPLLSFRRAPYSQALLGSLRFVYLPAACPAFSPAPCTSPSSLPHAVTEL